MMSGLWAIAGAVLPNDLLHRAGPSSDDTLPGTTFRAIGFDKRLIRVTLVLGEMCTETQLAD